MPTIIPLTESHAEEAAELFLEVYRREREVVPELPARDAEAPDIAMRLAHLLEGNPGAAAVEGGRLLGYLAGWMLEGFKGPERGVYCPEWGHAAAALRQAQGDERRGALYREMYGHMARVWSERGVANHAVTLFAHDVEARDALYWDGFGLHMVDAIRSTQPIGARALSGNVFSPASTSRLEAEDVEAGGLLVGQTSTLRSEAEDVEAGGLRIARATGDDLDAYAALADALADHITAPPISVHVPRRRTREDYAARLAAPERTVWLAFWESEAIGYLQTESPVDDVAFSVQSPQNAGVSGAYVRPDMRAKGVASALLERALAHARKTGMVSCSVDWESHNVPACRFWLRYFRPVCYSVLRRVDPRAITAI